MTGTERPTPALATAATAIGAVAVLAGGALHLRLAVDGYGTDDLISSFFVNAVVSAAVGAWLAYGRSPLPHLAGLGVSVLSLAAFALSRTGDGVLGFKGAGLDPSPDAALTLAAEAVATVALVVALVADRDAVRAFGRSLPLPGRSSSPAPGA